MIIMLFFIILLVSCDHRNNDNIDDKIIIISDDEDKQTQNNDDNNNDNNQDNNEDKQDEKKDIFLISNYNDNKEIIVDFFTKYLSSLDSYYFKYTATTKAKVFLFNYTQDTTATKIYTKDGSYINVSTSGFKSKDLVALFNQDNIQYKENKNDIQNVSYEQYISGFGYTPLEHLFFGIIVNNETLKSVTLKNQEDNHYTYEFVLDYLTSTKPFCVEAKKMGDLSDEPTFSKDITMTITITEDFTPIAFTANFEYKANTMGGVNCSQEIDGTFLAINKTIILPNIE